MNYDQRDSGLGRALLAAPQGEIGGTMLEPRGRHRYVRTPPRNEPEPPVPRFRPVVPHFPDRQARFQSFTERGEPQHSAARAKALRKVLKSLKLDGLLVPRADVFQGEYIPASENRLGWLTGFTGSAGFAILMADCLPLFVDGRYTVQAKAEVNGKLITVVPIAETGPDAWLKREAAGKRIGYDPNLFTARGLARFERAAKEAEITLLPTAEDPFAVIWDNRPAAPATRVIDHPETFAGESREAKITRLQETLREQKLGALLVSECPSVNWLFNIRAGMCRTCRSSALSRWCQPRANRASSWIRGGSNPLWARLWPRSARS